MKAPAVALTQVKFAYRGGQPVIDIPSLSIDRGETVFLYGPSGSGKTTLLGLLAGVLRADSGSVMVAGHDLTSMSNGQRDAFRARHMGYVFQMFNLIPYLSVEENILLPVHLDSQRGARLKGVSPRSAARTIAERLDIDGLLASPVTSLSVGQQQRVACARALIGDPDVVIADEPTSALDYDRREQFLELLFASCKAAGATLVFVSHDLALRDLFSRQVALASVNSAC